MGEIVPFPAERRGCRLCEDCGEQIPPARVRAITTVTRCRPCEVRRIASRQAQELGIMPRPVLVQD